MSADDAGILTAIQVSLGKIETTVESVLHRVRNMEQANQGFVPRREIEQFHDAVGDRIDALSERIKAGEDRYEWLNRKVWGTLLLGVLFALGVSKKTGLF
jgi:hypothetical protein